MRTTTMVPSTSFTYVHGIHGWKLEGEAVECPCGGDQVHVVR